VLFRPIGCVLPCLFLGMATGLFACKSHSESSSPASAPASETAPVASSSAPDAPDAKAPELRPRPPRHGGITGLVFRAARESSLTVEQKNGALDISQTLHDAEPALTPVKDYQNDLATAIRAGQVAPAKFAADYAAIDKVVLAREDKQADALNSLHTLLDAAARHTLVTAARGRLVPMFRPRPEFTEAGAADAADTPWVKHRVARLGGDLGLDDAQKAKVVPVLARTSLPPRVLETRKETMHKHADALLTAFEQDDFDAKKVDLSATGTHSPAHESLEHEASLISQLLPILTPEQREKLAVSRTRRIGHFAEEPEPWSPFEDYDPNLQGR
jgi:Spy/CpxP family protein refolding chaperone